MDYLYGLKEARLALALLAIDPGLKGVMIGGPPGTGKTVLARAARDLWPQKAPFVNMPLGTSLDRLLGGLDLETMLATGEARAMPGLLAQADGGVLYIDEINVLMPELAHAVQQALTSGEVRLERDGLSERYNARFALVGTWNPAEAPLSAAFLDRVAFSVGSRTLQDPYVRSKIARYAHVPFSLPDDLAAMVATGRRILPQICLPDSAIEDICRAASELGVEGNRAEQFAARCAKAHAALHARVPVTRADIDLAIRMVLLPRAQQGLTTESHNAEQSQSVSATSSKKREPEQEETFLLQSRRLGAGESERKKEQEQRQQARREKETTLSRQQVLPRQSDFNRVARMAGSALEVQTRAGQRTIHGKHSAGINTRRGRHIRSVPGLPSQGRLDLIETIKTGILHGQITAEKLQTNGGIELETTHLRIKQYRRRSGLLFCFAVDASGSMAFNRMNLAKGAAFTLLQNAYVFRDKVALLSFREQEAEMLLAPGGGLARARQSLEKMPTGGRTPISAALAQALTLAQQAPSRWQVAGTVLILITDGGANQPLRRMSEAADVRERKTQARREIKTLSTRLREHLAASLVIDSRIMPSRKSRAREIAGWLGGRYVYIGDQDAARISALISQAVAHLR